MTWKFSDFCTVGFFFMFAVAMSTHYAYMKSPAQDRTVATFEQPVQPWYDASYKF